MNNEIDVNDVITYIQFLKKERSNLMLQVKDIDNTLNRIKESWLDVNEIISK
jgi:hypothetical protein